MSVIADITDRDIIQQILDHIRWPPIVPSERFINLIISSLCRLQYLCSVLASDNWVNRHFRNKHPGAVRVYGNVNLNQVDCREGAYLFTLRLDDEQINFSTNTRKAISYCSSNTQDRSY